MLWRNTQRWYRFAFFKKFEFHEILNCLFQVLFQPPKGCGTKTSISTTAVIFRRWTFLFGVCLFWNQFYSFAPPPCPGILFLFLFDTNNSSNSSGLDFDFQGDVPTLCVWTLLDKHTNNWRNKAWDVWQSNCQATTNIQNHWLLLVLQ